MGIAPCFGLQKINILSKFSFGFCCSMTCLTGYISAYKLATLCSFCGGRSHMLPYAKTILSSDILE